MISCTEAITNFNNHQAEYARMKKEQTENCIKRTQDWCNTTLSEMINQGSSKGDRRVILDISDDYCTIADCNYLLKTEGYWSKVHDRSVHVPTIIRIAKDHGFTVRVKETTFPMKVNSKKNEYHKGKEYYIEWA